MGALQLSGTGSTGNRVRVPALPGDRGVGTVGSRVLSALQDLGCCDTARRDDFEGASCA